MRGALQGAEHFLFDFLVKKLNMILPHKYCKPHLTSRNHSYEYLVRFVHAYPHDSMLLCIFVEDISLSRKVGRSC